MSEDLKRDLRKLCQRALFLLKISYRAKGWTDKVKIIEDELKRREETAQELIR
jgi:hypothetical protein